MDQPDFELARDYALQRLERDLPPTLRYHAVAHTRDDVVPAAERLAKMEGVDGESLLLLRTAAYFHDLGYIEGRTDHEAVSTRIAQEVLPDFGYLPNQIDIIAGMIMATHLPQAPHTLLEQIMVDADLDVLGREDYWAKNRELREELRACGRESTDEGWLASQLEFLERHHYWTASARSLRDRRKQEHIAALTRQLKQSRAKDKVS